MCQSIRQILDCQKRLELWLLLPSVYMFLLQVLLSDLLKPQSFKHGGGGLHLLKTFGIQLEDEQKISDWKALKQIICQIGTHCTSDQDITICLLVFLWCGISLRRFESPQANLQDRQLLVWEFSQCCQVSAASRSCWRWIQTPWSLSWRPQRQGRWSSSFSALAFLLSGSWDQKNLKKARSPDKTAFL